jgi:hypothetical protein
MESIPERKYFSEFGLNMSVAYRFLLQQDNLSVIDKTDITPHIYMICRRPRIGIRPESTVFTKNYVEGEFFIQKGEKKEIIEFKTPNKTNRDDLKMYSDYPYTEFFVKSDAGEVVSSGKTALLMASCGSDLWKYLNLEILYIGQSFGVGGERSASERLKKHSTLQGIYSEAIQRSPDQEIWLLLSTFQEILLSSFDGSKSNYGTSDEEDEEHIKEILNTEVSLQQKINFTEAALIKYFQPHYNKIFKDTFPNPKHTSYSECYDLDLNMVSVEFHTEGLGTKLYSNEIDPKIRHFCMYPLHSKEKRMYMFDTEYI